MSSLAALDLDAWKGALGKVADLVPTAKNDLDPRQSQAFTEAMTAFSGELLPENLREDAQHHYKMLKLLQSRIKAVENGFSTEEPELSAGFKKLIERKSAKAQLEIAAFEEGLSPLLRFLWGTWNGLLILWDLTNAGRSPKKAYLAKRLPMQLRSVCLFTQYLLSPTANNRQMLDLTIQRTGMNLPNQIAATMAIALDLYGTKGLTAGTIGTSLFLVVLVTVPQDIRAFFDHRTAKKQAKLTATFETQQIEAEAGVLSTLKTSGKELKKAQKAFGLLRKEFDVGMATNNQATRALSAITDLLKYLQEGLGEEPATKADNPDRAKKFAVVAFGAGLAVVSIAAAAAGDDLQLLVQTLQWAYWYLYRLVKSARNSDHQLRDTLELASVVGAVTLLAFPFISLPLLISGPDVFNSVAMQVCMCLAMVGFNSTVGDSFGPWALGAFDGTKQMYAWIKKERGGDAEGASLLSDTTSLSLDDFFAELFNYLDKTEVKYRSRLDAFGASPPREGAIDADDDDDEEEDDEEEEEDPERAEAMKQVETKMEIKKKIGQIVDVMSGLEVADDVEVLAWYESVTSPPEFKELKDKVMGMLVSKCNVWGSLV
jgi:hypothetical protein